MNTPNYSKAIEFGNAPAPNEIEVSIFGSGFGESLAIHMGNGEWVIVDSCVCKDSDFPAPIHYLRQIGVDVSKAVKAIIATHWDDDHIKKISDALAHCESADFIVSIVLKDKKFLKVATDSPLSRLAESRPNLPTGITEFLKSLKICSERNKKIRRAFKDQRLWKSSVSEAEIVALSPHEEIFDKAVASILSSLPQDTDESVKRIAAPKPNFTSVVLYLKNGPIQFLLGADMEEGDEYKGWSLIINESTYKDEIKGSLYKVAHHGSDTGHHDQIWAKLLTSNPVCLIAPFNKNPKLPRPSDLQRIKRFSNQIYISSNDAGTSEAKSKEKHLKRTYAARNAKELLPTFNMIRARSNLAISEWKVECFGSAQSA